ncbi:N-lysine methyltransferase SMYD2-B-like [Corythoichthys intestinalis]|uniref:N-lysine methyltransferase SMYD2-B-like n=1 Tax=Corythoichthys intestinalis TaxID=161448 RepID=UPI0025A56AE0|nr:N-lysine methyltransferase SMYD2-B-like [Corythoichthys intestinalis]
MSIDGLQKFDSPDKGRGLRVSKAFQAGELLFSCPPYSYVLAANQKGDYCEFCFNRKESLARCGKCKKAFYCNVKCQKGDWAAHKLECSAILAFREKWCPSETARLVARILARKKTQKEQCSSERILLIGEMQSHVDDMDNAQRENSQADAAALHRFYSKHLDFPDSKELLSLFSQVSCNGFTIEDEELSQIGTAVYPDVALINHSCLPSVMVTFNGTTAEVRAVKDMKPGDEVLISYIDLLYPTDDRNSRLKESYYFTCHCGECQTRSQDEVKLQVRQRGKSPEAVSATLCYARKTINDFRDLKLVQTPSELLETCQRSLERMRQVLHDHNVFVLHMMYQAMGVCVYQGKLEDAVRYGEKIIQPFSQLYPAFSLNVSSLYLKLGRLYLALDRRSAGVGALKKAMSIMEVAHGKDHPYVRELSKHIAQASSAALTYNFNSS